MQIIQAFCLLFVQRRSAAAILPVGRLALFWCRVRQQKAALASNANRASAARPVFYFFFLFSVFILISFTFVFHLSIGVKTVLSGWKWRLCVSFFSIVENGASVMCAGLVYNSIPKKHRPYIIGHDRYFTRCQWCWDLHSPAQKCGTVWWHARYMLCVVHTVERSIFPKVYEPVEQSRKFAIRPPRFSAFCLSPVFCLKTRTFILPLRFTVHLQKARVLAFFSYLETFLPK